MDRDVKRYAVLRAGSRASVEQSDNLGKATALADELAKTTGRTYEVWDYSSGRGVQVYITRKEG